MVTATHIQDYNQSDKIETKSKPKFRKSGRVYETDTANYIADMILELRNLAKTADFKTLQGLLEISYYEAYGHAHHIEVPEGEDQHLHELGADARKAAAASL
jgi:hypothetical protein